MALLPALEPTPQLTTALVLILIGALTKSAQFPFHFWLPNAMSAPTPVSAYLHSATMVKLGVYLLARLDPGFGDWDLWEGALKAAGSLTAAWGMVLALLLAHALYKAPLFFVAGNIDHGTGTRVIDLLGNLRHAMPWTAAAALLAGASMAGIPLSFGYVVKDVILEAKSAEGVFAFARAANTVFGSIAVAVAGVAAIRVFWRHPGQYETPEAHEGGPSLVIPPLVLAAIGVTLGVFPFIVQDLISDASLAMTPSTEALAFSLALDLGPALGSLAVTLAIGALVYAFWDPLHRLQDRVVRRVGRWGMVTVYERSLQWIPRVAAASTRTLQDGRLPFYVGLVVVAVTLGMAAALLAGWSALDLPAPDAPGAGVIAACVLIVLGAAFAAVLRDRLTLLLATGLVGYGSAVLFLFTGAPDVAFTQFTVETVFVIVVASVLLKLKKLGRATSVDEPGLRPLAFLVAAGFAGVVTLLLLVATAGAFDPALTRFFAEACAARELEGERAVNRRLVILESAAGPLYWLILAASVWVLLRGHNEPGGGFIGGLVAVSATILWAVAHGSDAAAKRLPLGSPVTLAAVGVALGAIAGVPALVAGDAFLTHWWGTLPGVGIKVSTVLVFDLGVFLCVWGALGGYALALLAIDDEQLDPEARR